jgi:1-phosphofructokinase
VISDVAASCDWVQFSGSLCPGVESGWFAKLIAIAKGAGAGVGVDTSGEALSVAIEAGVDLIKPNAFELAAHVGTSGEEEAEATHLHERGVSHVIVSMGSEGAIFCAADGLVRMAAPPARVVSAAGAGDALVAGYVSALLREKNLRDRAANATAFAWCALESLELDVTIAPERTTTLHGGFREDH